MPPWAFCESLRADVALVEDAEAHHLLHVLRLKTGESVTLFDGTGLTAMAEIISVSRRDVTCRIMERHEVKSVVGPELTLAVSPPKGDRLRWMVEKLTETGVERLQLMDCERTVSTPGETRVDKLRATTLAACKQCRRPVFLEIQPMMLFQDVIDAAMSRSDEIYMAHPGNDHGLKGMRDSAGHKTILIGPEGGFTEKEVCLAREKGLVTIAWPETILRIETAAIVFAALGMVAGGR
ncbi:MAG: RsmE family RNA methyltransferase [Planctomycetota bacterium]